jgi:hypothetical protein
MPEDDVEKEIEAVKDFVGSDAPTGPIYLRTDAVRVLRRPRTAAEEEADRMADRWEREYFGER